MAAASAKGLPGPPFRSPLPAWPLRGLFLALGVSLVQAVGDRTGEPKWWRLRCTGRTAERWRLCNVRFFSDPSCTRAPAAQLLRRTHSQDEKALYGVPLDVVFTEFSSSCEQCAEGEVHLGVEFSTPVVVQCVLYTECPQATTEGVPTTTTVTTALTTTNPLASLADQFADQLGGAFGGSRRLGSASSCPSLMLERSARESGDWLEVAEWQPPQVGQGLALSMASSRVSQQPPSVSSYNPPVMNCDLCRRASVTGIADRLTLEMVFSEQIHLGPGTVHIVRGGLSELSLDPSNTQWFRVVGNRLQIMPKESLGASSGCTELSFRHQALQDADGAFFLEDAGMYTVCIRDTVPPTLTQTDPREGDINIRLLPQIRLEFDEEVKLHPDMSPLRLVPDGNEGSIISIPIDDETQVRFAGCPDCAQPGLIDITLKTPLVAGTRYRLEVPATSIGDYGGNAWPGSSNVLSFTTECPASGCSSPTTPTPDDPGDGSSNPPEESQNIPLYLGIVAGVVCCGAGTLAGWKYYVRAYVLPKRELPKAGTVPAAPTPAWTAKSAASTTGWRKPVPSPVAPSPAPDVKGVPQGFANINISVQSLNGSGTWGTTNSAASRVTATTTASSTPGPRVAGAAGVGEGTKAGSPAGTAPPGPEDAEKPAKGRAQTEEDIRKNPSNASGPSAGGGKSFNDDNTTAGGWVRAVDSATGRNYWYHYKTRETRWDDPRTGPQAPPRAKPSGAPEGPPPPGSMPSGEGRPPEPKASGPNPPPPRGNAKPEAKAPPVAPKAAAAPPPENTRAGRVKADILQQLEKTKGEDIASRKKTFRFLCLQWHPDKNQEDAELATEVFQFMQLQRDWYLKE